MKNWKQVDLKCTIFIALKPSIVHGADLIKTSLSNAQNYLNSALASVYF